MSLLWVFLLLFIQTLGEDDDEVENFDDLLADLEGEGTYRRHKDVRVQWRILDEPANSIPVGKNVYLVVSVANAGDEGEVEVTALQVFLHAKHDFDYYLQNYTRTDLSRVLAPHTEATFQYSFKIWDRMPLAQYQLSGDVHYTVHLNLDESLYMDKVFNETMTAYNKDEVFDYQLVMMVLMIIGIGLGSYYVFGEAKGFYDQKKKKKRHRD